MSDKVRERLRRAMSRDHPARTRLLESALGRYGLAVLSIAVSLAATYLLQPFVFPTPLFFLAIMVSTWVGGRGPGLLAVFLSTLSISFILSPDGVVPTRFNAVPNSAAFLFTALLVCLWSLKRRQAEQALRQMRDELETRVQERSQAEESLRESEKKYHGVFEAAHDVLVLLDEHGNILDVNNRAEQVLGYSKSELLRMNVFQGLYLPEDRPLMRGVIDDLTVDRTREYEVRFRKRDGTTVYFAGASAPRFSEAGEFLSSVCALHDITQRKRDEESLQKYTRRLETWHEIDEGILNARSPEQIARAVLNRIPALVPCRRAAIFLFDFERRESMGYAGYDQGEFQVGSASPTPFADLWKINEKWDELRQGQVIVVDDVRTLPPYPGIQRTIEAGIQSVVFAPLLAQGELIGTFDVGTDHPGGFGSEDVDIIREMANWLAIAMAQTRLFEEAVASRDRLRLLKQQLVEAQEIEQRRLAQELHDRIGQNLTALSINLHILSDRLSPDRAADLSARLNDSLTLVETTAEIIRDVTAELSSPVLDDYGLEAAIREYVQRYQQRTGIAVELQLDSVGELLRPEEQLALYRIAQEALTNVAKHAHASRLAMTLETTDQVCRLVIADNGVGFNPDTLPTPTRGHGLGLLSIRERAESIGGQLRVKSSPGQGTQVIVELKR